MIPIRSPVREPSFASTLPRPAAAFGPVPSSSFTGGGLRHTVVAGPHQPRSVVIRAAPEDAAQGKASEELDAEDITLNFLRLGSWRVRGKVCPPVEALAARIEGVIREIQGLEDLKIVKLPPRFEYADSLDPERKEGPVTYMRPDPEKGTECYPRLQIENRVYRSRVFRKAHLELAVRSDGLQVFHFVLYPNLEYDLPILCMDVVANTAGGDGEPKVSLAIADTTPVAWDRSLQPWYADAVRDLQSTYKTPRSLPQWGREIFSDVCVAVRPTSPEEVASFITYAAALTRLHMQVAKLQQPMLVARGPRLKEIHACHKRFCDMQLKNDKTKRVLEAAFSAEFADSYMKEVMFDVV